MRAVSVAAADGVVSRGWWVAPFRAGGGSVLLLHGIGGHRGELLRRAERLAAHGFGVLLLDSRAHGESGGGATGFGGAEAADVAAALAWMRRRAPGGRVGAIGWSLGGAALLLGERPAAVDAVVLEAVYPTIDAALRNRLRLRFGLRAAGIVGAVAVPVLRRLMPVVCGVRWEALRPVERIGAVRAPVLVMAGERDRETPVAETVALFERAPEPKRLVLVSGAGHVDLEAFDPERYWGEVLPFLDRWVGNGAAQGADQGADGGR